MLRATFYLISILLLSTGPVLAADPSGSYGRTYELEWGAKIPMRDGVHLNAMIFRPKDQVGPLPVIMTMTPYSADRFHDVGVYFASHGYVFASIDSRGRHESEGKFVPWVDEGRDGYDAIEWLARQPWSDGQIGSWGGSYGGKNQWSWAALKPPHLKSIVPASAGMMGYDAMIRRNMLRPSTTASNFFLLYYGRTSPDNLSKDRSFWNSHLFDLSRGAMSYREFGRHVGMPAGLWEDWAQHPVMDGFWEATMPRAEEWADIDIPVLSITGAYDASSQGTIEYRRRHLAAAGKNAADRSYLLIGPWNHSGTRIPKREVGGVDLGEESLLDVRALHVEWFDWVMKGGSRPALLDQRVVYYTAGANRWSSVDAIESLSSVGELRFLASPGGDAGRAADAGQLVAEAPAADEDRYVDDPSVPGNDQGHHEMVGPNWLTDTKPIERIDGNGLVYDTEVFTTARDLSGVPSAVLDISMDAPDADIHLELYEILADGGVVYLAEDMIRARYRRGDDVPVPVAPGKQERYTFDRFSFMSRTIGPGSRVRLVISPMGLSFHEQRNRNSGGSVVDETAQENRVANIRVALGEGKSQLFLPLKP